MKTFYIDADACPVKDEVYRVARRVRWAVVVVANQWIDIPDNPRFSRVVVEQGADLADDYIAEACGPGDIVITADIPLAARALEAGAKAMGTKGHEFRPESIGEALASRALNQELRESGVMGGGPKPMGPKDRSRVLNILDKLVQETLRQHP